MTACLQAFAIVLTTAVWLASSQAAILSDGDGQPLATVELPPSWSFHADTGDGHLGTFVDSDRGLSWTVQYYENHHVIMPSSIDADAIVDDMRASLALSKGSENPVQAITGFLVAPAIDGSTVRWILGLSFKGQVDAVANASIRRFTRDGFISLDTGAPSAKAADLEDSGNELIDKLAVVEGRRYEDFNPATDIYANHHLRDLLRPAIHRPSMPVTGASFMRIRAAGILALILAGALLIGHLRRRRRSQS